jgi:hypothetical protein
VNSSYIKFPSMATFWRLWAISQLGSQQWHCQDTEHPIPRRMAPGTLPYTATPHSAASLTL